jgi:hypothetical protein
LVFFFSQNHSCAQVITKTYEFPKFEILKLEDEGKQRKWLTFDGAVTTYEYPTLPVFWDKIEVDKLYSSYKYTILNPKYELLSSEEATLIPAEYSNNEPKTNIETITGNNRYCAILSIIPVVKGANGQYQRLVSCKVRFEGESPVTVSKANHWRNSVLNAGTWYKIAVNSTGLYKVTYQDLKNLKIPVSGLRSSDITLFGNGGGMISDINPVQQIDDLLEVPIMIKDNGNGVFDENSYFVFYAQGPHIYTYNENTKQFKHLYNIYADSAYYFINVNGIGDRKRIVEENYLSQNANHDAAFFVHYDFYEKDLKNFEESGRDWFDDYFSSSTPKKYTFNLPELFDNQSGKIKIRMASTIPSVSNMDLAWGTNSRTFSVSGTGSGSTAKITIYEQNNLPFTSGNLDFTLTSHSSQISGAVYLDYIEIQAKCKLKIINNAMPFALTENTGSAHISSVTLQNASSQTIVWDVTDHNSVYAVKGRLSGTQFTFHTPMNKPRRFIAFNGMEYKSVALVGAIPQQNLHGLKNVDMLIVSHQDFLSEAVRLAQFRATINNINVQVVTPEQIYNEFSSGAQDPAAIRNFMRYLYDNDSKTIKYLLLFGRPSYDYRGIVKGTQMFVPNFQHNNNQTTDTVLNNGYSFDDFFGVFGIGEGDMKLDTINVSVGRFPVSKLAEAKVAVDKTISASVRYKIDTQNTSQVSNFGDWRNMMTFVADDEDNSQHVTDAEKSANVVASHYPAFNLDKIYSDAYPLVSNAGGRRFPEANKAINMRMEKGTLVISYFGHGGGQGWAHERILEIVNITNWKNKFNQPLMITLTCSFGWYDKPAISPAELVFLNEKGGASALITTSRVTSAANQYGEKLFYEMGSKLNNRYKTVGEIYRFAKNDMGGATDGTNMIYLMGDPAMTINIPNYKVKTDRIIGENLQETDTLKALTKVIVKGRIVDDAGNTCSKFNGNIFPSVYDKAIVQKTLGQSDASPVVYFTVQKNILFKGNTTVTKGAFEFAFYVPKDINFEYGKGKISYYAVLKNEDTGEYDDAGYYYDDFIIGGMSDKPLTDNTGPQVNIFMNDDKFVSGGITDPNPVLFLKLKDEHGINTTGNGIGHDLVAVLDNNVEKQIVLNEYYVTDENTYNSGTVRYPLQDLAPGMHTIKVRAWDICNNPSPEASLDFIVKTEQKLMLDHVLNYPNPFTSKTSFYFEHNQPAETFDIIIHIFTISGKLVKTLQYPNVFLEGYRSNAMEWNGRDEYGDKIGKGVYIYRLTVRNSQGETAEKIEKITIL